MTKKVDSLNVWPTNIATEPDRMSPSGDKSVGIESYATKSLKKTHSGGGQSRPVLMKSPQHNLEKDFMLAGKNLRPVSYHTTVRI